jgi:hypothetical protein
MRTSTTVYISMTEEDILFEDVIRVRRMSMQLIPAPEFGNNISVRWGARFFQVTPTQLWMKPMESSSIETRTSLNFSVIATVRWPTAQECEKGFSLGSSLSKLLNRPKSILSKSSITSRGGPVAMQQKELSHDGGSGGGEEAQGSHCRFIVELP